jgi:hypothetical protein
LRDGASEANPLLSLHTRLTNDDGAGMFARSMSSASEILIDEARIVVRADGKSGQEG